MQGKDETGQLITVVALIGHRCKARALPCPLLSRPVCMTSASQAGTGRGVGSPHPPGFIIWGCRALPEIIVYS